MPGAFATHYEREPRPVCRLCGKHGPLTFEHLPPKRCFNDSPVLLRTLESVVKQHKNPQKFRRGLGTHSLCKKCNNGTAIEYGRAFAEFTRTAMEVRDRIHNSTRMLYIPFTCTPLRVVKQIAVMAIAMSGTFTHKNAAFNRLRSLVLDPKMSGSPYGLEFWCYLMPEGDARLCPMVVPIGSDMPFVWCEIALPPVGYVVTGSGRDDYRIANRLQLCNLNFMFERAHNWCESIFLRLPILKPLGGGALQYEGYDDDIAF